MTDLRKKTKKMTRREALQVALELGPKNSELHECAEHVKLAYKILTELYDRVDDADPFWNKEINE